MATLPKYNSIEVLYAANEKEKANLLKQGYIPMMGSDCHVEKTTLVPAYSQQLDKDAIKYLGKEPDGFVNSSIQYSTYYYEVKKEDFAKMPIKPHLEKVCMPLRLHNYDGIVDIIQKERKGTGWEERHNPTFNVTITRVFFVID